MGLFDFSQQGAEAIDATLAADVTIVSASTFVDGPSAAFGTGTWLVMWKVQLQPIVTTSLAYFWTAKLWDGSTVYDEGETTWGSQALNQSGWSTRIASAAIVTLTAAATLKVSAAEGHSGSSSKIARDVADNSATSHTATRLSAIKLA